MIDRTEKGFTLMELLTVLAIIGVLLSISSKSYQLYKKTTYNTITKDQVRQAKTALAAGKIDNDFMDGWGFASAWLDQPGPPSTAMGQELLPGLINPDEFRMSVWHDAWCASGMFGNWCTIDSISAWHCKGDRFIFWQSMRDGTEWSWEWTFPPWC